MSLTWGGGISMADVAKHNSKTDCWVVVDGQVDCWVGQGRWLVGWLFEPAKNGWLVGICPKTAEGFLLA